MWRVRTLRYVVSEHADTAVYQQVAEEIRSWIAKGRFSAGDLLPAERVLLEELNVGREAVRDALALLRREGLVETHRGRRARVRVQRTSTPVPLARGRSSYPACLSPDERLEHDIPEGVPVLVVADRLYPADRFELTWES